MAEMRRGFAPPPEVIRYFEDRSFKPSFSWRDVFGAEHANASAIAKVTELELHTLFKGSLSQALARGQGFESWRTSVVEELRKAGWGLPRHVADPTGRTEGAVVDFTSARRLKTIFWGNMSSARAAGQWERAQRSKRALPYFLYIHTTSAHPRKDHLQWVGLILPVDDPIWTYIFPPNGWHCKCTVRQISAREREELLSRPVSDEPGAIRYTAEAPKLEMRTWTNTRTGEVMRIPKDCDPGWGGHPGLNRVKGVMRALEEELVKADPADATRTLEQLWQSPWTQVVARLPDQDARNIWLPAGVSPTLQAQMGARSPLVSISGIDVKRRANHDGAYTDGRGYADLARLPAVIGRGTSAPAASEDRRAIWGGDGDGDDKKWWRAIVTKSAGGFLRVISTHRKDGDVARKALKSALHGRE